MATSQLDDHPLDRAWMRLAEAARSYLLAFTACRPTPTLAPDREADRLVDASHRLERAQRELAQLFD